MKKALTLFILAFTISLSMAAQITITSDVFPAEGDTSLNYVDVDGSDLDLLSPGGNLFWDFTSLTPDSELNVFFLAAAEGDAGIDFPDADLVAIIQDAETERYLKIEADHVAEVGFAGLDPILRQLKLSTLYESDYTIQIAPLGYGDTFKDSTVLQSKFLFDSLPEEIKSQLGAFRPDSIRVDVSVHRTDEVDAWGKVSIPGGTYDVLRNKSIEIRNTSVFAYTSFLGWANVTNNIRTLLTDPSVLDPIELTIYSYLSNDFKEPVAAVTLDTNGMADQVQYKNLGGASSTDDQWAYASVKLTPNPTYGKVKLLYSGLPRGSYNLVIHDILGNVLMTESLELDENGVEKMDFSQLSKGTYLYSLRSEKGETITTKRLVLIRP